MPSNLTVRYRLTGTLVCRTPVHVGGAGDDPYTDLPVARDGRDRCYVPGTSLAGALREWCRAAFATDPAGVWGFQKDDDGHASFVTVDDVFVDEPAMIPEVRDGVRIDRKTGAAEDRFKFDRAVLPRGTRLTGFVVTAEVPAERAELALAMLAGLCDELTAGRIRFGAARTRGLGRVDLRDATLTRVRLDNRDDVLNLLRDRPAAPVPDDDILTARAANQTKPTARTRIQVAWQPAGPVMVKAGFDGIAADVLPLVSALPGGVAPVLPGSSVKGALRSRAEQIVRTLFDPSDDKPMSLVEAVFGSHDRAGAVSVADCYAAPMAAEKWNDVVNATDEKQLREALDGAERPDWQQAFHVAVDRWTGGAADGALYTVLEPHGTAWEPLELDIDAARAGEAGEALVLMVLRDLAAGRLPLGFGVNRGMGAVTVTGVTIDDAPLDLSNVPQRLKDAWKTWVETKGVSA